ncbi:hypothetical protein [Methanoculleus sp.]|uniref:hypothetical protein n=1 Tax=Methanoculleus sp. TaxID=90427 RepID=UPI0025E3C5D7|nr:hypothetical protein [Methanoculleus sp.]MCK9320296.1 hypothetical protein [Methanoculleus sp.]
MLEIKMLEKFTVAVICLILMGVAISIPFPEVKAEKPPEVKAEKPPEVVEPASRMKLVEQSSLSSFDHAYLISLDNKEYMIVSHHQGGIQILEVTK